MKYHNDIIITENQRPLTEDYRGADIYYEYLNKLEEKGFITLPQKYSTNSKSLSTFQNFEIQASSRNKLISYLKKNNISTIKQWGGFSIAHFSKLGFDINNYPLTKKLFDKLLLLPYIGIITICIYSLENDASNPKRLG